MPCVLFIETTLNSQGNILYWKLSSQPVYVIAMGEWVAMVQTLGHPVAVALESCHVCHVTCHVCHVTCHVCHVTRRDVRDPKKTYQMT